MSTPDYHAGELCQPNLDHLEMIIDRELLGDLFRAGIANSDSGIERNGPLAARFNKTAQTITALLSDIHPDLAPLHLQEFDEYIPFDDRETKRSILSSLSSSDYGQFRELQNSFHSWFTEANYDQLRQAQTIPDGSLDVPPYHQQESKRSCAIATFRMLLQGITERGSSEFSVKEALIDVFGSSLVNNSDYRKFFTSQEFVDRFGFSVKPLSITGATLPLLGEIAKGIKKETESKRKVFCTVPALSEYRHGIWHETVLLGDDADNVIWHDPSELRPGESRRIDKASFHERWAASMNRAHIYVCEVVCC